MRKSEKGFTLFEVLVSMFIAGVALLALALMEVHILRSSQSSFNYTVATIRANSFVDTIWSDLCNAQQLTSTYGTIKTNWISDVSSAGMTAVETTSDQGKNTSITVSWSDPRFNDSGNDTLTLNATFPDIECW